jgi:hypothetical protein
VHLIHVLELLGELVTVGLTLKEEVTLGEDEVDCEALGQREPERVVFGVVTHGCQGALDLGKRSVGFLPHLRGLLDLRVEAARAIAELGLGFLAAFFFGGGRGHQ